MTIAPLQTTAAPLLFRARGPVSELVLTILGTPYDESLEALGHVVEEARLAVARSTDLISDDDVQLALFALYGISYGNISPFENEWEWHPTLIETRLVLERAFENHLRSIVPVPCRIDSGCARRTVPACATTIIPLRCVSAARCLTMRRR